MTEREHPRRPSQLRKRVWSVGRGSWPAAGQAAPSPCSRPASARRSTTATRWPRSCLAAGWSRCAWGVNEGQQAEGGRAGGTTSGEPRHASHRSPSAPLLRSGPVRPQRQPCMPPACTHCAHAAHLQRRGEQDAQRPARNSHINLRWRIQPLPPQAAHHLRRRRWLALLQPRPKRVHHPEQLLGVCGRQRQRVSQAGGSSRPALLVGGAEGGAGARRNRGAPHLSPRRSPGWGWTACGRRGVAGAAPAACSWAPPGGEARAPTATPGRCCTAQRCPQERRPPQHPRLWACWAPACHPGASWAQGWPSRVCAAAVARPAAAVAWCWAPGGALAVWPARPPSAARSATLLRRQVGAGPAQLSLGSPQDKANQQHASLTLI